MTKNKALYVLMTEKEINYVKQLARDCGVNTSEFVRLTIKLKGHDVVRQLNGSRKKLPPIDIILEKEYAEEIKPTLKRYFPEKWVKQWYGEE